MSSSSMLSSVLPDITECTPHELLPIMPPSVHHRCVAGIRPERQADALRFVAQPVEHDARLHPRLPTRRIDREDAVAGASRNRG